MVRLAIPSVVSMILTAERKLGYYPSVGVLFNGLRLPMNLLGESPKMEITVTVPEEIVREAGVRGLPVIDFLESLIDKGFNAEKERPALTNAMERIRALRSTAVGKAVEGKK